MKIIIDEEMLKKYIIGFVEVNLEVEEEDVAWLANDIVEDLKEEGFTEENLTQEQLKEMQRTSDEIRYNAGLLEHVGMTTSMEQREVGKDNEKTMARQNMELVSNIERLEKANLELRRNVEMMEDMYR
ncbi:hypothetical protein [Staphylococcus warneri]|uniref:hypothetical protein n=1 Tax=Staphylococcus warneri TaxID=1292 RepID=UPI0007377723|nr:hypothetical protein [Staphylococcus warneri]KTW22867.1 hypothetical protein SA10R_07010 [Staphylococcus warneri]MCJ1788043.1 hypothetical protein [Staphylococcus warneri]MCJ1792950.1 hypothetical protein [Staphylococcus warneri]MCJ1795408.1 hypothetical protein [Staphylococcus warneri]MCJ1797853.1 hypothetical protein [Staphylococcus warneri]